jgi:hypothetical protein
MDLPRRPFFTDFLALGLACLACLAFLAAPAVAAQPRQVLETWDAGAHAGRHELSLAACEAGACAFELRLVGAGAAQSAPVALGWPATEAPARPVAAEAAHGTGTPLDPAAWGARVWSTGQEESTITVSAHMLPLPSSAKGRQALLVTQMAGFEHLKRRHALYVASANGPRLAWSHEEPPGPTGSWVLAPAGQWPLLLRQGGLQDGGPERMELRRLQWNAGRQVFVEKASRPPAALQAVVAGRHAGVAAAQAARQRHGDCLAGYAIVRTRQAGTAPRHALIQVAADTAEARAETRRLQACDGRLQPRTVPLARLLAWPGAQR